MPSKTSKKRAASPDSGRENERRAPKKQQKRVKVTNKEDTPKSPHIEENTNIRRRLRRECGNDDSLQSIQSIGSDLVSLDTADDADFDCETRKRTTLNVVRAERRRQEDSGYLQKRAHLRHTAATKLSPMIVEEWSLTLKSLLNHRTDKILQGVEGSEGLSSLARLKSIITIMCTNDSILPFANDNPVWNKVELVAEMLLDIFADPFHFDVAKWVDAGLLVPSSEDIFKDYDLDGEAEANWELEEMLE